MNPQFIKVSTPTDTIKTHRSGKKVPRKKGIAIHHVFLMSRIIISIFITGLIGYVLDRIRQGSQAKK